MRTRVFAHKGIIGIESNPDDCDGLINDLKTKGQLGMVIDASFVDISPEALELLKTIPKSADAIGDVDVYKADDGKVIFSFLTFGFVAVDPRVATGSSLYDASLLTSVEGIVPNPEFVSMVDTIEG